MIYTKEDKLTSRQIDTMILSLEDFSDERITPLNKAHAAATALLPDSPDKTAMQAMFNPAAAAYEAGVTVRNLDISGRSEDVSLFYEQASLVGKRVSAIKRKVIEIKDDKATLVYFNLTNIKYYTDGHQSDIQKNISELLLKVKGRPEYATVLPFVVSLHEDLGGIFDTKSDQISLVTQDKEAVDPLVQTLKEAYIYDKGILNKIYCKDITKTFSFFPLATMYGAIVRAEDYVTKNQAFITKPIDPIINLPTPSFTNTNLIEIDNLGPKPIQAYKLITISKLIPESAITIPEFSTYKGAIRDLGPDTAKNLMLAFPADGLDTAKARVTIKPRKKAKK